MDFAKNAETNRIKTNMKIIGDRKILTNEEIRRLLDTSRAELLCTIEQIVNAPVTSDDESCVYCNHYHPEGTCACGCSDYD